MVDAPMEEESADATPQPSEPPSIPVAADSNQAVNEETTPRQSMAGDELPAGSDAGASTPPKPIAAETVPTNYPAMPPAPPVGLAPPIVPPASSLGLIALIVGIVAAVSAFIPILSFITFIPAAAAIVLGIVALVRRAQPRSRGFAGIILGGAAWFVAIIVSIVTIAVVPHTDVSSANTHPTATHTAQAAPAPKPSPIATPEETTSAEPTPEPTPTETEDATPPYPADIVVRGRGDSIIRVKNPDDDASFGFATISSRGNSNFAVWSLDSDLQKSDLLVNTIGKYKGTVAYGLQNAGDVARLQITAHGAWTVTYRSIKALRQFDTELISGKGDGVLIYQGDAAAAAIRHVGRSNFSVWEYGDETDLLVNEIGKYRGVVPLGAGTSIIVVNADGKWSIKAD